jgi:hypothetical protein
MVSFLELQQNPNYSNKIYVAVTNHPTEEGVYKERQVFVKYNGGNNFTYYLLDGSKRQVIYPNNFHDGTLNTNFLEISKLPTDLMESILSFGSSGGGKRRRIKTRGKKRNMKRRSRKNKNIKI